MTLKYENSNIARAVSMSHILRTHVRTLSHTHTSMFVLVSESQR